MAEYKQPQNVPTPNISFDTDPNTLKAGDLDKCCGTPRVSMGNPGANKVKTDGIKVRGTGAATRGVTARGPMA
jgi:hypothetical protein